MVEPSWAVTDTIIVVLPVVFSAIADDDDPDATVVPFTFMIEVGAFAVGVKITEVTDGATDVL